MAKAPTNVKGNYWAKALQVPVGENLRARKLQEYIYNDYQHVIRPVIIRVKFYNLY